MKKKVVHGNTRGLSISAKLSLALGAVAAIMIVTITISVIEYRNMSERVSVEMFDDIADLDVTGGISAELLDSLGVVNDIADSLKAACHEYFNDKKAEFEMGFYRSIIPSVVAVGAGLLLIFLLMFFINVYYVRPLYRMLDSLENYLKFGKTYTYLFDGDDQLQTLNSGITDIVTENCELKRRVKRLKEQAYTEKENSI